MKITKAPLPKSVPPEYFTGDVSVLHTQGVHPDPLMDVVLVTFPPGGRTAWHHHVGPQILVVVEGCCRVQTEGGPVQDVATGGTVRFESGELHWHGATPDAPMVHVALQMKGVPVDPFTIWSDPVTDAEYDGAALTTGAR